MEFIKDLIEKHAGGVVGGWDNLKAVFLVVHQCHYYLNIFMIRLKWISMLA